MKYSFFLAHPSKESSAILVALRDKDNRVTLSTGITINTKNWDKQKKNIKPKTADSLYNEKLQFIDGEVQKQVRFAILDNLSIHEVKDRILKSLGRGNSAQSNSLFLPFYQYWATNSFNNHTATKYTLLGYKIMKEYLEYKGKLDISFEDIGYAFYTDFVQWMRDKKEYAINTQGNQVKHLKSVMNEAYKRKLHENRDYNTFTKFTEDVDNVYLTIEEYDKIYNLPLTGMKAKARDLFIIGCYTALRYSDYSRITPDDIRNGFLYMRQKKTDNTIVLPVHHRVKEVIDKYNGAPQLSQVKFNLKIKEVCREAGITEKIGIREKGKYLYVDKCDLVSSHTARRSAATNMALMGTPLREIMLITGHKTEKQLLRYIIITQEQNARLMQKNPFFRE